MSYETFLLPPNGAYTAWQAVKDQPYEASVDSRYVLILWKIGSKEYVGEERPWVLEVALWCVWDRELKAMSEFWGPHSEERAKEYVEMVAAK